MTPEEKMTLSQTRVSLLNQGRNVGTIETALCRHCQRTIFEHADLKCLLEPTSYAPSTTRRFLNFVREDLAHFYANHPVVVDDATYNAFVRGYALHYGVK